jgi:hypothetical protein
MNMAKIMLKIIVNKVIIKCINIMVNKVIKCINVIVMIVLNIMVMIVLNVKVKIMGLSMKVKIVLNVVCSSVIVRLVSITPGHVKLD